MALMQTIPGLQQHRKPSRGPRPDNYDWQQAKAAVDRVFLMMGADIPDDLLDWLHIKAPEQYERVMAPWREIEVCDQNRDLAGVKNACAAMVDALQRGVRLYNSAPAVVREQQLEML